MTTTPAELNCRSAQLRLGVQYGLDPLSTIGINGASADPDHDGKTNIQEYIAGTNPTAADTDNDGLPDAWETQHGLNPNSATGDNGAAGDPDHDGDGRTDDWEVRYGLDPLDPAGANGANGDPDGDGLTNAQEAASGTNPEQAVVMNHRLYLSTMLR